MKILHFVSILIFSILFTSSQAVDFRIWRIPENSHDISVQDTKPGIALIGGGDNCGPAFSYLIDNSNLGDFVVIRASGDDSYNEYIYNMSITMGKKLNSVTTILFNNGNASYDKGVQNILESAEGIFIAGGDQSVYLKFWENTPIQSIIQKKLLNNVSIGGTSAGLAILGNYIYSAEYSSAYSDESLENPYIKYITLTNQFLNIPFLQNTITDTHFSARDRMGRMLTFVARVNVDYDLGNAIHGIGVDEQTALLLNIQTGDVSIVGVNQAFICGSAKSPEICKADTPLTYTTITCTRLTASLNHTYSFSSWSGQGINYSVQILNGLYSKDSLPYGPN